MHAVPPLPPKNVCVTATTDSSISVSWDPPAENPGGRNLTYSVYTSLDGGATRVLVANVPVTSATIMSEYYTYYVPNWILFLLQKINRVWPVLCRICEGRRGTSIMRFRLAFTLFQNLSVLSLNFFGGGGGGGGVARYATHAYIKDSLLSMM